MRAMVKVLALALLSLTGLGVGEHAEAVVFDIHPGPEGSAPRSLVTAGAFGQHLFFFADDGTHGDELWHWDGDRNVLMRITDLEPGIPSGVRGSKIQTLGDHALFVGITSEEGYSIYSATAGQTEIVQLANDGEPFGYENSGLAVDAVLRVGDRLVFRRPDGGVYSTDGTLEGTTAFLTDIRVFEPILELERAAIVGDRALLIDVDRQLWSVDPLTGESEALLPPGNQIAFTIDEKDQLVSAGSFAVFRVDTGENLWVTDGTAAGTKTLVDRDGLAFVELIEIFDTRIILARSFLGDPAPGVRREIWQSGGAPENTKLLGEIEPLLGFHPVSTEARVHKDRLIVLEASEGPLFHMQSRRWTYSSDVGWQILRPVEYGLARFVSEPRSGNENLVYSVNSFDCVESSDGTLDGTHCVIGDVQMFGFGQSKQIGDKLFFEFSGQALVADGTLANPLVLFDESGNALGQPAFDDASVFDDTIFFGIGPDSQPLWRSDGTADGTRPAFPQPPGAVAYDPREPVLADNRYFFAANTSSGRELVSEPRAEVTVPRMALQSGDRFDIAVRWTKPNGETGLGSPTRLTEDSGHFFFFRDTNLELMIKVLDGRTINDHFWVFYGSLSNVAFTIEVTDRKTGRIKVFENAQGEFASVGDIEAIAAAPEAGAPPSAVVAAGPPSSADMLASLMSSSARGAAKMTEGCLGSEDALCVQQSRFEIEASWEKPNGDTGTAKAVPLTNDTGAFYFFRDSNLELLVKVLDGRDVNGHFWVFYGALSNVRYELTVTDTDTGVVRSYVNPQGRFASVGDTHAFAVP